MSTKVTYFLPPFRYYQALPEELDEDRRLAMQAAFDFTVNDLDLLQVTLIAVSIHKNGPLLIARNEAIYGFAIDGDTAFIVVSRNYHRARLNRSGIIRTTAHELRHLWQQLNDTPAAMRETDAVNYGNFVFEQLERRRLL